MGDAIDPANFERVPDLPQTPFLIQVVKELWQDPATVAVWLGGSLARGQGDRNSDVDLRVALRPETYVRAPPAATPLFEMAVVHQRLDFSDVATLHHMLLRNGQIYDLLPLPGQQGYPALSGDRLVWQDSIHGDDDVFTATLPDGL